MACGLIVQKFGGTSVKDAEARLRSANLVKSEVDKGLLVVVVVSAAAGSTQSLVDAVGSVGDCVTPVQLAEYDSVVSAGEQISSGLFALTLISLGVKARSWAGWQVPVTTDASYSNARVIEVKIEALMRCLQDGNVCVVAGFQGVCQGRITTLGRGGSDTSAAALAAALKADRCDIYTDVQGVFSADPRVVGADRVSLIPSIGYEEMLELAALGAGVLHPKAVELAMHNKLEVRVLSSLSAIEEGGIETRITTLTGQEEMEKSLITGVTATKNEVMFTLSGIKGYDGFRILAAEKIVINTIIQNYGSDRVDFTANAVDEARISEILKGFDCTLHRHISVLSMVGVGMLLNPGVASVMFETLHTQGIDILGITTSEIRVSVIVDIADSDMAVQCLHTAFGLDS